MRLFTLSLLALFLVTGCDSTEEPPALSTEFVVGTWTFDALRDDDGSGEVDRTADAEVELDDFQIEFDADGRARIMADLTQASNDRGNDDLDFSTDYSVGATALTLGIATLDAAVRSDTSMDLTGSGQFISELLGLDLALSLNPSATLTLVRR